MWMERSAAVPMMSPQPIWHVSKTAVREWLDDNALRLSAALSYYTTFSLAPLLLIVIALAGLVLGNDSARAAILAQITLLIGPTGAAATDQILQSASQPKRGLIAAITGGVMLLLGATGVVGQLQDALNTIWEVEPKPGGGIKAMLRRRVMSFAMILGIAFLLLVSLVVSAAISALGAYWAESTEIIVMGLHLVVSTAIITVLFAAMFKFLPDVKLKWRDVWIGAFVTAVLFTVGKTLTGLYLAKSTVASSYGAAGSIVIILIWVYYSSASFLLGAEFTQVYARYRESKIEKKPGIVPKPAAHKT
jgi:membrane protein